MMGHAVTQISWLQGGAKQAGDRPADAEAEANKQRRKAQNRKNQRAHRESIPRYNSPYCAKNPFRATAQEQSLGDCSVVTPIPGQSLAPRGARPLSSQKTASIRARNKHARFPSTSHIHSYITVHRRAYYRPPRLTTPKP
jgi:hypothetical protein